MNKFIAAALLASTFAIGASAQAATPDAAPATRADVKKTAPVKKHVAKKHHQAKKAAPVKPAA